MTMKHLVTLASFAVSLLLAPGISANDSYSLDSEGYIRHWLMLAPIPLEGDESGSEAIYKRQIRGEATLRPKAGETVKVGGRELTWQSITASKN